LRPYCPRYHVVGNFDARITGNVPGFALRLILVCRG
jgi:hypothetical protein